MADLFDVVSTYPVITGVVVLVVCWLVVRYFTGRKRRVRDYAKKFDPVDVSTAEIVLRCLNFGWNTDCVVFPYLQSFRIFRNSSFASPSGCS